jgi:hypothetical protein
MSHVSNAAEHELACRFRIHTALDELARAQLDVERDLFVHLLIERNLP